MISAALGWWAGLAPGERVWILIGFFGQSMFFTRFLVQWIASERVGRSVVPSAFWFFSIAGGLIVLAYAIYKGDPVFIFGQLPGIFIYSRNIFFVMREKRLAAGSTQ